jgi:hypothetical protein
MGTPAYSRVGMIVYSVLAGVFGCGLVLLVVWAVVVGGLKGRGGKKVDGQALPKFGT